MTGRRSPLARRLGPLLAALALAVSPASAAPFAHPMEAPHYEAPREAYSPAQDYGSDAYSATSGRELGRLVALEPPQLSAAELAKYRQVPIGDGKSGYEVREGLVIPTDEFTPRAKRLLDTDITGRPRLVASFIDPSFPDSARVLSAAGQDGRSFRDLAGLRALMRAHPGSLVVVVGHSENGRLIKNRKAESGAGPETVGQVALDDIVGAASEEGVALYLLSCEAARQAAAPGPRDVVFTFEIETQLKLAIKAKTYAEFLAAFGTREHPSIGRGLSDLPDGGTRLETDRSEGRRRYAGVLVTPGAGGGGPVATLGGGGSLPAAPDNGEHVGPWEALFRVLKVVFVFLVLPFFGLPYLFSRFGKPSPPAAAGPEALKAQLEAILLQPWERIILMRLLDERRFEVEHGRLVALLTGIIERDGVVRLDELKDLQSLAGLVRDAYGRDGR